MKMLCLPVLALCAVVGILAPVSAQVKAPAEVTLTGRLDNRVAAGGDTSGWALRYSDDTGVKTIEVELSRAQMQQVKDGGTFRVTGTIVDREKVERGTIRTLVASRVEAPEPK